MFSPKRLFARLIGVTSLFLFLFLFAVALSDWLDSERRRSLLQAAA